MSPTTSLEIDARPLASGLRRKPNGRIEARFGNPARSLGTFDTEEEALLARAQAMEDAKAGRPVRRDRRGSSNPTVAEAAQTYLARRERDVAAGKLRASSLEQTRKELRPWLGVGETAALDLDGFPLADYRLSKLATLDVCEWYEERRVDAPSAARKELFALKAVLRDATRFGAEFALGLLEISPGRQSRRVGKALAVDALDHFASCWPELIETLPHFLGTVGLRIGEALLARREHFDAEAATLFVPAANCKENRGKTIPLLAEEVELIQLQLARHEFANIWPRPRGGEWVHWQFHGKVWGPARDLAAASWKRIQGVESTPFDDLRPHDLRHTAATLMRRANFEPELAALRLGHKDAGWLLMTLYNHPDAAELQRAIVATAGTGIRATLAGRSATGNVVSIRTATGGRRAPTAPSSAARRRSRRTVA